MKPQKTKIGQKKTSHSLTDISPNILYVWPRTNHENKTKNEEKSSIWSSEEQDRQQQLTPSMNQTSENKNLNRTKNENTGSNNLCARSAPCPVAERETRCLQRREIEWRQENLPLLKTVARSEKNEWQQGLRPAGENSAAKISALVQRWSSARTELSTEKSPREKSSGGNEGSWSDSTRMKTKKELLRSAQERNQRGEQKRYKKPGFSVRFKRLQLIYRCHHNLSLLYLIIGMKIYS
jgi:hypothetical protein